MSNTDNMPGKLVSDLDQMVTILVSTAEMVATYYKTLLENGVPKDLAFVITKDFSSIWWNNALGKVRGNPNEQHQEK